MKARLFSFILIVLFLAACITGQKRNITPNHEHQKTNTIPRVDTRQLAALQNASEQYKVHLPLRPVSQIQREDVLSVVEQWRKRYGPQVAGRDRGNGCVCNAQHDLRGSDVKHSPTTYALVSFVAAPSFGLIAVVFGLWLLVLWPFIPLVVWLFVHRYQTEQKLAELERDLTRPEK